jgi:AcrR family transcriptional regulator
MARTGPLTTERILEATEEVLRRRSPAKATVVDVARALGVSHGSVYRHFRTKAALREAVTECWLDRTSTSLSGIVSGTEAPEAKLRHWLLELFAAKRRKVGDDQELFATYMVLVGESSAVVDRHVADLTGQLAEIVREGAERGISRRLMRLGR